MLLLQTQKLSYRYPQALDPLFHEVSLSLYKGDKVVLLGHNGSGKTTLLNLLTDEIQPDEGTIIRSGSFAIVRQEDTLETEQPLLDALVKSELLESYKTMTAMEKAGLPDPLEYANVVNTFTEENGFAYLQKIEEAITALGFSPRALNESVTKLSGGQRRLLKLVAALLHEPDILILDEPTNHLDERTALYLVEQINTFSGACLIVSHDRWFLDQTVTKVLELEHRKITEYKGNYSVFRDTKEGVFKQKVRQKEKLEVEISKLEEIERSYKVWGGRKEKEKSGAANKGFIGARAARLQKRAVIAKEKIRDDIETLEREKPWIDKHYPIALENVDVPTGTCFVLREVSFSYTENRNERLSLALSTLAGISFTLEWGERLALRGSNGSGKSTLIKLLLQELSPQHGEILWSRGVKLGYLPQLWQAPTVNTVAELFSKEEVQQARTLLGALHVKGDHFYLPLESLSEGQKRKVSLVQLILSKPNVMILDEPTTHLDYESVEMLESALADYGGTLILVTHDKYLLERLTTRELNLSKPLTNIFANRHT
ncbi:MAG: ribosomal protection-like ABC-F family protein [Trueperaceae bacterium]